MVLIEYDRTAAVEYAHRWAYDRNPRYFDFSKFGGDCASFVSQCLYAGCGVMNYSPVYGWYYISAGERTAAWSGAPYLYNFLTGNKSVGPYGTGIGPLTVNDPPPPEIRPGDVVQLGNDEGRYYHTLLVIRTEGGVRVAAHTYDVWDKPLNQYVSRSVRYIHILGARNWQ